MKLLLIVVASVALSGCLATPVARTFPGIPPALTNSCPDLKMVPEGTTQLSQTLEIVADNYAQYYQCQALTDSWQSWYRQQRKIFESVK
jgi:hypothetical protein